MYRDIPWSLCRIAINALLSLAMFLAPSLLYAKPLLALTLSTEVSPDAHKWLHGVQADEPMPPEQRDVLEELMETRVDSDLKAVFELYLNRNRRLTDKNFETFSKILQTARRLENLEEQKEVGTRQEPKVGPEEKRREEKAGPTPAMRPEPGMEADRSALRDRNADQPSAPSVDLDFLYHDAKPMRPL